MEAINTLLNKTSGDLGQELVSTFFVPLVLRMANDDHEECSALARALLGRIFRKVESSKRKGLLQPLEAWIEQRENPPLTKLAMQAFGVLFEAVDDGLDAQVRLVCRCIEVALKSPASDEGDLPGEALKLLLRLTESRPDKTLTQKSASIWTEVRGLLQHPFASIQVTAASLTATFFQHCQPASMHELPLQCSHGLSWDEGAIRDVLKASARIVKGSQEATVHQRAVS
ncbi:MAG: U3 snoRNP protein, partial [Watsoniomyces obsoletus]